MNLDPAVAGTAGVPHLVNEIAAFVRRASFETTRLSERELDEVKTLVPAGAAIYASEIPSRPLDEQIGTVRQLRAAGFEPVPHVAARNFGSVEAMEQFVRRLVEECAVRRVLVIAGDRSEPAGELVDSLAAIDSGVLQRCGIVEIGIAGYPEGHPRIGQEALERALAAKIAAAEGAGLRVRVVTQFSLSAAPILAWLGDLRARGITQPVSIGLAGPTSLTTLLRFARICGVKASAQGFARNVGLVRNLMTSSAPDPIVRVLAESTGGLGVVAPHFFSFGGLVTTVRWVSAVAAGRIALDKSGFQVLAR